MQDADKVRVNFHGGCLTDLLSMKTAFLMISGHPPNISLTLITYSSFLGLRSFFPSLIILDISARSRKPDSFRAFRLHRAVPLSFGRGRSLTVPVFQDAYYMLAWTSQPNVDSCTFSFPKKKLWLQSYTFLFSHSKTKVPKLSLFLSFEGVILDPIDFHSSKPSV